MAANGTSIINSRLPAPDWLVICSCLWARAADHYCCCFHGHVYRPTMIQSREVISWAPREDKSPLSAAVGLSKSAPAEHQANNNNNSNNNSNNNNVFRSNSLMCRIQLNLGRPSHLKQRQQQWTQLIHKGRARCQEELRRVHTGRSEKHSRISVSHRWRNQQPAELR